MATDSPSRVIKCCHNQQMIAHYTGKGLSVVAVNGTTREVNAAAKVNAITEVNSTTEVNTTTEVDTATEVSVKETNPAIVPRIKN